MTELRVPLRRARADHRGTDPAEDDSERRVPPRVALALPSARAVVGGLLVAVSILGIFAAHRSATAVDTTEWLIVARPVPAGREITAADLARAPMRLVDATAARAVADPRAVIGRVALVGLRPGDLLMRGSTAEQRATAATARRVTVTLSPAAALGGALAEGDRVDVVAIGDAESPTEVVVRGAIVGNAGDDRGAGGVGSTSGGVQVTLDVADEEAARALIAAHAAGGITLIAASPVDLGATR